MHVIQRPMHTPTLSQFFLLHLCLKYAIHVWCLHPVKNIHVWKWPISAKTCFEIFFKSKARGKLQEERAKRRVRLPFHKTGVLA